MDELVLKKDSLIKSFQTSWSPQLPLFNPRQSNTVDDVADIILKGNNQVDLTKYAPIKYVNLVIG